MGMRDCRLRLKTLKLEDGEGEKKREPIKVRELTAVPASLENERSTYD